MSSKIKIIIINNIANRRTLEKLAKGWILQIIATQQLHINRGPEW